VGKRQPAAAEVNAFTSEAYESLEELGGVRDFCEIIMFFFLNKTLILMGVLLNNEFKIMIMALFEMEFESI
jgi:hypothetical protein